jgi:uncharacterized membrane protein YkoI
MIEVKRRRSDMTNGKLGMTVVGFVVLVGSSSFVAGAGSEAELLKALPSSKQTLASGIKQAQGKAPETAISAKFEMDDKGQLALSVYTAEKGLAVDAEHNVLKELIGSPADTWSPEVEVFKDVPHVSRSAQQLAVMATSKLTLEDIIKQVSKDQPGTVYSVIPVLRDRRPVFEVKVASGGKTVQLTYDAATGIAVKGAK